MVCSLEYYAKLATGTFLKFKIHYPEAPPPPLGAVIIIPRTD